MKAKLPSGGKWIPSPFPPPRASCSVLLYPSKGDGIVRTCHWVFENWNVDLLSGTSTILWAPIEFIGNQRSVSCLIHVQRAKCLKRCSKAVITEAIYSVSINYWVIESVTIYSKTSDSSEQGNGMCFLNPSRLCCFSSPGLTLWTYLTSASGKNQRALSPV